MCPSGVTYLSVGRNQDNVSEWGDTSICWSGFRVRNNLSEWGDISISRSGLRIMCPSEVTNLSVGPESG